MFQKWIITYNCIFLCCPSLWPALNVNILTPAMYPPTLLGSLVYTGPAFDTALRDIRQQFPLLNVSQRIITDRAVRSCTDWEGKVDDLVASKYYALTRTLPSLQVTAIILPGCTETPQLVKLATQWDVLIVSSVSSSARGKLVDPTWISTSAISFVPFLHFYRQLIQLYSWTNIFMLLDLGSNTYFIDSANQVKQELAKQRDIQLYFVSLLANTASGLNDALSLLLKSSRVCLYFGRSDILRNLLVIADSMNMTNGDYVYIAITPFRHVSLGNFSWNYGDSRDNSAWSAFRSLFLLEIAPDGNNDRVSRSLEELWCNQSATAYGYTYKDNETISPHPASSYAAVMIFAQVVSERYAQNVGTLFGGRDLAKGFFNSTFRLKTGDVRIDGNGDRIPCVVLRQMENSTSPYRTCLMKPSWLNRQRIRLRLKHLIGHHCTSVRCCLCWKLSIGKLSTGRSPPDIIFELELVLHEEDDSILQTVIAQDTTTFKLSQVAEFLWPSTGWPVSSRPSCGFDGLACRPIGDWAQAIYAVLAGFLSISLLTSVFVIYRRVLEQRRQSKDPWWNLLQSELY